VDKGKTLDQVVEAVPVLSSATLSRTELGTRDTPMSQLKALANYFGVSVDDITKPSDEAEPWELPEPSRYQPKPETTVMTPEQYALRVYIPRLEAENAELREQLAMFRGER
jgi:transcriptional regulator with XRE-family HTH domain